MTIEKINFSYPKGSLQSVFDTEEMTALELASKTSKKVDECVELVNGVEQIAIEATGIVDDMRLVQEQFMTENNDIRQALEGDNQTYLDTLQTDADAVLAATTSSMATALDAFTADVETELNTTKNNITVALNTFTADINTTKAQITSDANEVIQNSSAQITADVTTKLNTMATDGTITNIIDNVLLAELNAKTATNEVVVSELEPTDAKTWLKLISESSISTETEEYIFINI